MLFAAGVTSFPSNKTPSYYLCLLTLKKDIPTNLRGDDYEKLMKGSTTAFVAMPMTPLGPAAASSSGPSHPSIALWGAADEEPPPDDEPDLLPPLEMPDPPAIEPPAPMRNTIVLFGSDDEAEPPPASSSSGVVAAAPAAPVTEVIIEGHPVRIKEAYVKGRRREQARWFVKKCPIHDHCGRSRSVMEDFPQFGVNGVRIFMGCWLRAGLRDLSVPHRSYIPTTEEMNEYAVEHGLLD